MITKGTNLKFNICGGSRNNNLKDYLNVDIGDFADIKADVRKPLPIDNECASDIFSCATLEHLTLGQVNKLLKEFYRILQPGGNVIIGVPGLRQIMNSYLNNAISFRIINMYIYGGQRGNFDYHKSIYDIAGLKEMLEEIGFIDVQEVEYDLPFYRKNLMMKVICKKNAKESLNPDSSYTA